MREAKDSLVERVVGVGAVGGRVGGMIGGSCVGCGGVAEGGGVWGRGRGRSRGGMEMSFARRGEEKSWSGEAGVRAVSVVPDMLFSSAAVTSLWLSSLVDLVTVSVEVFAGLLFR